MPPPTPSSNLPALAGALFSLAALASCDDSGPRVYTAMAYRAERDCLDDYAPIGLVQAADLSANCDAVCLTTPSSLEVSTVCPPYPALASPAPPDSPDCIAALAALDAGRSCGSLDGATGDAGASPVADASGDVAR
jgi:hypothetical protein